MQTIEEQYPKVKILSSLLSKFDYIFLRGSGGTGKSTIIGKFIESKKINHTNYIFLGPTGKAIAVAEDKGLRGVILHRFFGIQTNDNTHDITEYLEQKYGTMQQYYTKIRKQLINIKYIFIDEISMINNELLEHMLVTLQECASKKAKVIISGDFHQLPPIIDNTIAEYRNVSSSIGVINDLINADVMTVIDFITRYRSEDENYNEFLHDTRLGIIQDANSVANYLAHYFNVYTDRKGIPSDIEKKLTFLEFVNAKVKYINDSMLEDLPGAEHRVQFKVDEYIFPHDKSYAADDIINSFQMDQDLVFKIGSKIVFRTNNHELGYKNGDEGLITAFSGTDISIDRFFGKDVIKMKIPRHEYSSSEKQKKAGYNITVKQFGFSLCSARTIHRAQGDEYQFMHLDFSFLENGMISNTMKWQLLYVAISRVTYPKGVWIHRNSIDLLKKQFRLFSEVDHNLLALNIGNKEIPYIRRSYD